MNEKIQNDLLEQGYSVIKNAFSLGEFKQFREILNNTPFQYLVNYGDSFEGVEISKEKIEKIKTELDKEIEKRIIEHTLKYFKRTDFFKKNFSNYVNNGWNAFRINFPYQKFKNVAWHQDIQTPIENKLGFQNKKFLTFWIPFTNVNEDNSIEILKMRKNIKVYSNHYRIDLPLPKELRSNDKFKVKISACDLVILDNFTFHRSVPNITNLTRASIDLRFTSNEQQYYKTDFVLKIRMLKSQIKSLLKRGF